MGEGGGAGRAGAGEGQHKEAAARQVGEGWVEADLDVIESVACGYTPFECKTALSDALRSRHLWSVKMKYSGELAASCLTATGYKRTGSGGGGGWHVPCLLGTPLEQRLEHIHL